MVGGDGVVGLMGGSGRVAKGMVTLHVLQFRMALVRCIPRGGLLLGR